MTEMKTLQFGEDGEIFEVTDEKARNKAKNLIKVTDEEVPDETDLVVGEEGTEIEVVTTADISELRGDLTQLSGRTETLETALIGVDAAITRLEAAV